MNQNVTGGNIYQFQYKVEMVVAMLFFKFFIENIIDKIKLYVSLTFSIF